MRHSQRATGIRLASLLSLLLGLFLWTVPVGAGGAVHVLRVQGVINPVTAGYISRGIDAAEKAGATAVVIELDTPGGLESSMRQIVQRFNAASVPVVVYVWPPGGRAASAGTFITLAGHVAAMAPNTSIGAAHPVGGQGEEIEGPLGEKVTNDAVAFIRGIARLRNRNEDWAEKAVRESVSVPEYEAVEINVVDLTATDLPDLLRKIDGRQVSLPQGTVTLQTAQAPIQRFEMTLIERFLLVISDPNIAFMLLSLGFAGIFFELLHPGGIFPGVFGAIALLLAFFALGTLPVNWAGVALIGLAFLLFFLELFIASHGILGLGGTIALAVGGMILVSGTGVPGLQVSRWLVFGMTGAIAAFFLYVVAALLRIRKKQAATGSQGLIGKEAEVRTPLTPEGMVFVDGALWNAISEGGPVDAGRRVTVTAVEGLRLRVRPVAAPLAAPAEPVRLLPGSEDTPRSGESVEGETARGETGR